MKRNTWWISLAAAAFGGCAVSRPPVALSFPEFPENVTVVDLGQTVTIDVAATNDDGAGVTWNCAGEGCAPLKAATPTSVTFKASGITGEAVITAKSKKQPEVTKNLAISVNLNEAPDVGCGTPSK